MGEVENPEFNEEEYKQNIAAIDQNLMNKDLNDHESIWNKSGYIV